MQLPQRRPFHLLLCIPILALLGCGEEVATPPGVSIVEVEGVGFQNPAAILHDSEADVYLVANIVGRAGEEDGQGFISQISPDGEVLNLNWIQLFGQDLALHSPQGMALRGDTLFVADLQCVRLFERTSGSAQARLCVDDATWISDVDVGPEGSVFVTDMGLRPGASEMEPTGTDAVYRLVLAAGQRGATLARDEELGHPAGIAVGRRGIFVTTAGTGEVFRLTPEGERTAVLPPTGERLSGIVFLPDGGFVFASQSQGAVVRVTGEGRLVRLAEGLGEPAGIGYDESRNRILVPLLNEDRIIFLDLEEG